MNGEPRTSIHQGERFFFDLPGHFCANIMTMVSFFSSGGAMPSQEKFPFPHDPEKDSRAHPLLGFEEPGLAHGGFQGLCGFHGRSHATQIPHSTACESRHLE
jgi:hypothetical protein